jgi:hypothetical protein
LRNTRGLILGSVAIAVALSGALIALLSLGGSVSFHDWPMAPQGGGTTVKEGGIPKQRDFADLRQADAGSLASLAGGSTRRNVLLAGAPGRELRRETPAREPGRGRAQPRRRTRRDRFRRSPVQERSGALTPRVPRRPTPAPSPVPPATPTPPLRIPTKPPGRGSDKPKAPTKGPTDHESSPPGWPRRGPVPQEPDESGVGLPRVKLPKPARKLKLDPGSEHGSHSHR